MLQTAKVVKLREDGRAEVAVTRQSACGHDCAKCGGGCANLTIMPTVTVWAENPVRAMEGDTVTVESSSRRVLGAAVLVYLVPFLLFFLGYCGGRGAGFGEGGAVGLGFAGFAAGLLCAVLADRRERRRRTITFRITAIQQSEL